MTTVEEPLRTIPGRATGAPAVVLVDGVLNGQPFKKVYSHSLLMFI